MSVSSDVLCDDLIAFFSSVKHHLMRLGEQEGLTPVQMGTLYWLHRHGELAMGQIAHVMHCDASNVTGIVDRLVIQGLVSRQESARDRRARTLRLTPKGTLVVEQVQRKLPSAIGWDSLTADECDVIHKIIRNANTAV